MYNGTPVNIVVPFGPNAGLIIGSGVIVDSVNGGIDGLVYFVKEEDGTVGEYADSWIMKS